MLRYLIHLWYQVRWLLLWGFEWEKIWLNKSKILTFSTILWMWILIMMFYFMLHSSHHWTLIEIYQQMAEQTWKMAALIKELKDIPQIHSLTYKTYTTRIEHECFCGRRPILELSSFQRLCRVLRLGRGCSVRPSSSPRRIDKSPTRETRAPNISPQHWFFQHNKT